jgi:hypothetical protein
LAAAAAALADAAGVLLLALPHWPPYRH